MHADITNTRAEIRTSFTSNSNTRSNGYMPVPVSNNKVDQHLARSDESPNFAYSRHGTMKSGHDSKDRNSSHNRTDRKSSHNYLAHSRYSSANDPKMKQPPSPHESRSPAAAAGPGLTKSLLDQHEAYHDIDPNDEEQQHAFIRERERVVKCNWTYNFK